MSPVEHLTINVIALVEAPWWMWLYVVAVGLMCAAAFAISTFWKDRH